ncbi:hypothetical protein [Amycolatopsis sp. lyj-23]|uniref:hypothetical protein n=1 Tax=Amycolatopsis sp. lyj-23 TaxID=2789283 RepID=UPI0039780E9F
MQPLSASTVTSLTFVAAIVATVVYLSVTKSDVISDRGASRADASARGGLWQKTVFLAVVLTAGIVG